MNRTDRFTPFHDRAAEDERVEVPVVIDEDGDIVSYDQTIDQEDPTG